MKIEVRYQSRGGNTRAMAEIIAETLGIKAESIDKPLNEYTDLLFLGGAVYGWDIDPQLKEYLKKLDSGKIGQIVAFSTTGAMATVLQKIKKYGDKAGIKVNEKQLCLRIMLQGHTSFGREGGHFTHEQVGKIKKFASEVFESLQNKA